VVIAIKKWSAKDTKNTENAKKIGLLLEVAQTRPGGVGEDDFEDGK